MGHGRRRTGYKADDGARTAEWTIVGRARNLSEARRRLQARALGIRLRLHCALSARSRPGYSCSPSCRAHPATRPLGAVLTLAAIGPAGLLAHRSVRRGRPGDAHQVGIAMVAAPVLFAISLTLIPAAPAATAAPVTATPSTAPSSTPTSVPAAAPLPSFTPPLGTWSAPPTTGSASTPTITSSPPRGGPDARTTPRPGAAPRTTAAADPETSSGCDVITHYTNTDGDCVRRPVKAATPPPGATAKCGDGTYSSSRNRSGTCSKHGGVAQWL